MMTNSFFFDTYAFVEIVKGNNNYDGYLNSKIVTTKLNLFELCFSLLKDYNEKEASSAIDKLQQSVVDFDNSIIKEAAKLKKILGRGPSMTDCIGYTIAKKMNIKFLTGDKQFEFLPDVEFVK